MGEEVGQALVDHPGVDLIAFTGSREVGLAINRRAAEPKPGQDHVKRVIAEMGGKNAIIVDDDADLDEAVVGVLQSAFGYAGQKCSACSRVIVLDGIHDAFLRRLVEAARAVDRRPGRRPRDRRRPGDRRRRPASGSSEYQRIAATEGRVVLAVDVGPLAERGNFVGPMIVADVSPDARIAQEEIFGPVLAVLQARDLDDALRIANGTAYALTGGLYSRSPANIERVKREFRVGNLYINRADHRRPGRPPAVRRVQALGDRHQGRRPRLPARIPADPHRHREHHAPRLRPRYRGRRRHPGVHRRLTGLRNLIVGWAPPTMF